MRSGLGPIALAQAANVRLSRNRMNPNGMLQRGAPTGHTAMVMTVPMAPLAQPCVKGNTPRNGLMPVWASAMKKFRNCRGQTLRGSRRGHRCAHFR